MKEHRHPHPHVDPRQPRHRATVSTNPPVFAWKPLEGASSYGLKVATDREFSEPTLNLDGLGDPLFLPEKAFERGLYFWQWSSGEAESEVFEFEVPANAVTLEVPPAEEWLRRLPDGHPRMYVSEDGVPALRESLSRWRAPSWERLRKSADSLLGEAHEFPEPPFLKDKAEDYQAAFEFRYPLMWEFRGFAKGAETLALAYLCSGGASYGRAACQRMASLASWDPEGSSHLEHHDEAHMAVIWHGSNACDWAWDQFTDEELELVVRQFRRRGQITYDYMHNHGLYGLTRFDSHAGREVVFLALLSLVFHEHIPEASGWLDWLRPILCGVWPIWAGDDGGWAEGHSYAEPYNTVMTMFATALKHGAGVDLFKRPFWKNHAEWRYYTLPAYAEWMGFGDHSDPWSIKWRAISDLVELIGVQTGTSKFDGYVESLRQYAGRSTSPEFRVLPGVTSQLFLAPEPKKQADADADGRLLHVYPAVGWAAIRSEPEEPERDVALIFRSSPYGAISHSHANNNDFILHVGGKVMAMPSGYYDGYGSNHHAQWVWHSKSHNCVTLSDASQIMRSHDSRGAVENVFEDELVAYMVGNADASYSDRAERCRRHVLFLKPHSCFVMVDEFVAAPGIVSSLQWNLHSWNTFDVDEAARRFKIERDGSSLEGHMLYHNNAFFTMTEGWDPPPMSSDDDVLRHQQYHMRFTVSGPYERQNLGVVLSPGHPSLQPAQVETERSGEAEIARIGEDLVLVNQGQSEVEYSGVRTDALALLTVQGRLYELRDQGLTVGAKL